MKPMRVITPDLPLFTAVLTVRAPCPPCARLINQGRAICLVLLTATLAACGGGGGGGPEVCQVGVSTMQFPTGCPSAGGSNGTPTVGLSVSNPAGTATAQVSPGQAGTLQALVKDRSGGVAANVAVTFTTTDATATFVPASGTALSGPDGVASVGLPAGRQAGAFTATANATLNGTPIKTTLDYAVRFPTLSLGVPVITPTTLSAGGNASLSVNVLADGLPYTAVLEVSFSSPCSLAGKAVIGAAVLTQNGVANTSYTDKGCGVADLIKASVTLGDATATSARTLTVLPASAGSIKFVAAASTNIALKGTGGVGRQEFSTLKFEVSDRTGNSVPGTLIDFVFADSGSAQTVGGLTLFPSFATSAADGSVTTLVTAGTIPTSVRVVATVRGSAPPLTSLSNILVISTGVPDQKHFSLATSIGNCEGLDIDQVCATLTATLGDHFGNPVPDGTAVNFSAEGGVIDASCITGALPLAGATPASQTTNSKTGPGSGTCSVLLRSSNPRPDKALNGFTPGRVTVLAYALGEEDFFDSNGNNVFDPGEPFTDKRSDIFRNDDESGVTATTPNGSWNAGEPCIGPNTAQTCSTAGDGVYNGVLRIPQSVSAQTLYVSGQLVQLFSGSHAFITYTRSSGDCPASGVRDGALSITDRNKNLMPAGSLIFISSTPQFLDPPIAKVNNVVLAVGEPLIIPSYAVPASCSGGSLFVKVVTPAKVETIQSFPLN